MKRIQLIVLASLIPNGHTRNLRAQVAFTGVPSVDSASVARSSWAAALRALRADDMPLARREVSRAASAWPSQQAYVWGRAVLAARARDTAGVMTALEDYTALGLGRDLQSDTTFAAFVQRPWFARFVAANESNRSVLRRSIVRATLSDSTIWPEGMDYNPVSGRYYVASVRHRTIVERAPNGSERELFLRDTPGNGAVLGVRVEPAKDVVWATMAGLHQMQGFTPADSAIASLVRVRISNGKVERRWDLPTNKRHVLGDLAIGPKGDVFVTDSDDPVLYRLRPGADSLEPLRHPLFRSLQGVAPSPDGRFLFLADYSLGILRVDLATKAVIRLTEPPHVTTLGCDGIVLYRGTIVAVQNGVSPARIVRFQLDEAGERIVRADVLDRNWKLADEPTIGAMVGNEFVYVANSQWEKYEEDGSRKLNVPLARPVLLGVRIDK